MAIASLYGETFFDDDLASISSSTVEAGSHSIKFLKHSVSDSRSQPAQLHGTIMTAGPLAAEQALASKLTPSVIHDLVAVRPSNLSAENVEADIKHFKTELKHGASFARLTETLDKAYDVGTAVPLTSSGSSALSDHDRKAGKALAQTIAGALAKDLMHMAPEHYSHARIEASVEGLKENLRSGQGLAPWLYEIRHPFGGGPIGIGPIIHQ